MLAIQLQSLEGKLKSVIYKIVILAIVGGYQFAAAKGITMGCDTIDLSGGSYEYEDMDDDWQENQGSLVFHDKTLGVELANKINSETPGQAVINENDQAKKTTKFKLSFKRSSENGRCRMILKGNAFEEFYEVLGRDESKELWLGGRNIVGGVGYFTLLRVED